MKIKLTYTGYLKFDGVESGSHIEVQEGSTVGDVLGRFRVVPEQQRFLRLFVNDETADPSRAVQDGDELTVIMQIGGG
ncbi:MAG: MoaD/ThiS family protein [bacterium]|nr:MoaD/ThiS family protein [bacterium]